MTPAERSLALKLAAILAALGDDAAEAVQAGERFDPATVEPELRGALMAALQEAFVAQMLATSTELGMPIDPAQVLSAYSAWTMKAQEPLIKGLTETSAKAVEEAVAAFVAGTVDKQGAIDMLAFPFGASRAELIATTEMTRAKSQAQQATATYLRRYGINTTYVWRTANDERVCPICGPRDGQTVMEDMLPPAHPRCRCAALLEVL